MNNQNPRRTRLIGPGTIAMVVGLAAFGVYSSLTQSPEQRQVFYESDSKGVLQEVERPSHAASAAPALWKPEPGLLLDNRAKLALSEEQVVRVQRAADTWAVEKAGLELRLKRETAFLTSEPGKRTSVGALQTGLGSYSELSREYGRQREHAWSSAVAILTKRQRDVLARLNKRKEVNP